MKLDSRFGILLYLYIVLQNPKISMEDSSVKLKELVNNGKTAMDAWKLTPYLEWAFDNNRSFTECCLNLWHVVYANSTLYNLAILFLKYIPTGLYTYKFIKSIYVASRDRIKRKQLELEEIKLQIQIVNTKISVRDGECQERVERRRRGADRLRRLRARVRDVIAGDHALRRAVRLLAEADYNTHYQQQTTEQGCEHETTSAKDCDLLMELLKQMQTDRTAFTEKNLENMDCGERPQTEPSDSVYSSLSDNESKKDCRLKIIKVTNVYKVAYLKHYIKQKRLRRANKQAILKKKMESIKQLLEDWQKMLSMVINSKLTLLNLEPHPIDVSSQDAMGDYSKPNLRESSDSESDIRNSNPDTLDEYSMSWAQNSYRSYVYPYEDMPGSADRNYFDSQEFGDSKYASPPPYESNGNKQPNALFILPEETSSQIAIEEVKRDEEEDVCECHDLVVL